MMQHSQPKDISYEERRRNDRLGLRNGLDMRRSSPWPRQMTKAETLERLAKVITLAHILPQVTFTVREWHAHRHFVLNTLRRKGWLDRNLIVRSSALQEDQRGFSLAGKHLSIPNTRGLSAIAQAVNRVIESFSQQSDDNQVLLQPMLESVILSGVAFSADPSTGSPYLCVNYDSSSQSTDSVTSGRGQDLHRFYRFRNCPSQGKIPPPLDRIISLLQEVETIFGNNVLDIEFALTSSGELFLLQARQLFDNQPNGLLARKLSIALRRLSCRIDNYKSPRLLGKSNLFGVMPDWNPAEIIGIRPRPLALSLYRALLTPSTWARQRALYGYRDVRGSHLLLSFGGQPYIDVRASCNSLVPADLPQTLAGDLVSNYLERLRQEPATHDRLELDIALTCYTFDLPLRLRELRTQGFSASDCACIAASLRSLTKRIIQGDSRLWPSDIRLLRRLQAKCRRSNEANSIQEICSLFEDCKQFGMRPFVGLARTGFIAMQLLQSLVTCGLFDATEQDSFLASLGTVTARMLRHMAILPRERFLARYGHLRPGTYEIASLRYDEAPALYFDWTKRNLNSNARLIETRFHLSPSKLAALGALLEAHGLGTDPNRFLRFLRVALLWRERAKFVLSRSLSEVLRSLSRLGEKYGLSREELSYLDIRSLKKLGNNETSLVALKKLVQRGVLRHEVTMNLNLPPLISKGSDIWSFHLPPNQPSYLTQRSVIGHVATAGGPPDAIPGSVLFIQSADPGYDWIFSQGIKAFVTLFGGPNSHMAIRAIELGIPAVIGVGPLNFQSWSSARRLEVNCAAHTVRILQ